MIDLTCEVPVKPAEVAAFLGVSRRTVRNWFDQGLESVKLGHLVFTTLEALQRFAEHRTPQQTDYGRNSDSPLLTKAENEAMRRNMEALGI